MSDNWQSDNTIHLRKWNYDTNQYDDLGTVDTYILASSITPEQFANLLDRYLNAGGKGMAEGKKIGRMFAGTHRTLQAYGIRFVTGFLRGITEACWGTDPRNEYEIAAAHKMLEAVDR